MTKIASIVLLIAGGVFSGHLWWVASEIVQIDALLSRNIRTDVFSLFSCENCTSSVQNSVQATSFYEDPDFWKQFTQPTILIPVIIGVLVLLGLIVVLFTCCNAERAEGLVTVLKVILPFLPFGKKEKKEDKPDKPESVVVVNDTRAALPAQNKVAAQPLPSQNPKVNPLYARAPPATNVRNENSLSAANNPAGTVPAV